MWERSVGGGGAGYTPDICFSRSPNECSGPQNINCLLNIFDLIARDSHPTNFRCINVSSIDQ